MGLSTPHDNAKSQISPSSAVATVGLGAISAISAVARVSASARVLETDASSRSSKSLGRTITSGVVSALEAIVLACTTIGVVVVRAAGVSVDTNTVSTVGMSDADTLVVTSSVSDVREVLDS